MEIKAKLIEKYETATFGASGFRKREFVVEFSDNPQYPEFIKMELIQDKCDLLDSFEIGAVMNVAFNLKGRKYEHPEKGTQYFNNLQAWRLSGAETAPGPTGTAPAEAEPEWLNADKDKEADDLPFVLTLLMASSFALQYLPI